jgi:AsmA-like protein
MRRLPPYGILALAAVAALFVGTELYVRSLGPRAKIRVTKELTDRFNADVSLDNLHLSLFPSPTVVGGGLTLRHRGWNDPHPLISISHFTAESTFFNLFFQRDNVQSVRLEGLEIHVPRRGKSASQMERRDHEEVETAKPGNDRSRLNIGLENMIADDTLLEIEPKEPGKNPMRFEIKKLRLSSVSNSDPLRFEATLTNPKPPGLIHSRGHFGPWQKDDPRATAVSGDYEFDHADLGAFKGVSGTLSSTGTYSGVLQHIQVNGQTDTPDFALKRGGSPVHLRATFQSTVNGINGDTILEKVDARFLGSEFVCEGKVAHEEGKAGKTVSLFAVTKNAARMEDILYLIVGDKTPLMTGSVQFQSKIVIPPGKQDVADKLYLNGQFKVLAGVFTSPKVNEKLLTLSRRARGISKAEEAKYPRTTVASNLYGSFKLKNGTMSFSHLSFAIPGAGVKLTGDFNLPTRKLDLTGLFRMQATLSDTQSGIKHWLLMPLDPIFRKNGAGVELPFTVTGTRDHPTLAVSAFHHTIRVK